VRKPLTYKALSLRTVTNSSFSLRLAYHLLNGSCDVINSKTDEFPLHKSHNDHWPAGPPGDGPPPSQSSCLTDSQIGRNAIPQRSGLSPFPGTTWKPT